MQTLSTSIKRIFRKRMEEKSLSFYDLSLLLNRRERQIDRWFSDDYDFNLKTLITISTVLDIKFSFEIESKS